MHHPSRLALLLVVVATATPVAGKTPLSVCKQTCSSLVAEGCADLRKRKLKRCRTKIWRQCKRGRIACVATSTTLPPGPGCAIAFEVGPQLPGGSDKSIASGDLDGDGKRDLVVVANPAVMVRRGNGDGTLGPLTGYDSGGDARGVALADLNGDGKLDVAAANFMSNPPPTGPSTVVNVSVLMNLGNGTLGAPVPYFVGNRDFHDVVAADFNGDHKLDLAVATHPSTAVLLNAGNGTFAPKVDYPAPNLSRGLAAADLDGDGKVDLAIIGFGAPSGPGVVAVRLGNGDGTFRDAFTFTAGRVPYAIVAGDVNGDGKLDLATANNNGASMSVLLGNGDGTFGPNVDYAAGGLPTSLAGGDFNADGRLDFVISAGPSATVGLFTGRGDGTFAPVVGTFTGGSAALTSGDFDGDGKADVATATPLGHRVLLSRCR